MPPGPRRASTMPSPAVRVSRSPPRQPSAPVSARSMMRPESSIRPSAYTAATGPPAGGPAAAGRVPCRAVLSGAGMEVVKIPPRSPQANAYAERFVLTARTEVTDRMLIFGERHLWTILAEYEAHYNGRRPHRSRHLRPPRPDHPVADLSRKRIQRQPLLGGLINEYKRAA